MINFLTSCQDEIQTLTTNLVSIVRQGALRMLNEALQQEVAEYIAGIETAEMKTGMLKLCAMAKLRLAAW